MDGDLTAGIVAILKPDRATKAGTGFVVSDGGLVASCAHVVQYAGAGPGDSVDVVFHATGERRSAKVEPEYWRDPASQDVAILRLEGALPDKTRSLLLGGTSEAYDHRFSTFGFPPFREERGMWGYGTVGNLIDHEAAGPVLQLSSTEVTPGFSGAPVLDDRTGRVVGMVSEITVPDRYGRLGETAFATPTKTLLEVCADLQLSEVCPYRRLDTFREVDAEFFFGRERVVRRLLDSLRREPSFLAVLGPSGGGKSSLIQAGLIPALRQGKVLGSENWGVVITHRYDSPFEQIEAAGLVGAPRGLPEAAGKWLKQHPEYERLVLVLDQFEELLAACSEPLRRRFVKELTDLLSSPCPTTIVLTMQDIFYSRFAREAAELAQEWLPGGLVQVPRDLGQDDLVSIVQKPASKVGLRFEPGLVEEIVNDAMETASFDEGGRTAPSTILPLLESALTELWKRREDGRLTRGAYADIGRLTGGLTQWADQALKDLGDLRPLAKRIFTELVDLGDASQGIRNRRRRRRLAELRRDESEGEAVQQVVRRLASARLLVTTDGGAGGQESVEIIHDTLLREWGRLDNWLSEEERRYGEWRLKVRERAQGWLESSPDFPEGRDRDELLTSDEMSETQGWLSKRHPNLSKLEHSFLRACAEAHKPRVPPWRQPSGGKQPGPKPPRPESLPGAQPPRSAKPTTLPGGRTPRPKTLPVERKPRDGRHPNFPGR